MRAATFTAVAGLLGLGLSLCLYGCPIADPSSYLNAAGDDGGVAAPSQEASSFDDGASASHARDSAWPLEDSGPDSLLAMVDGAANDSQAAPDARAGCLSDPLTTHGAVASSALSGNPAALAVDGNFATRWESRRAQPEWIYLDLGAPVFVNRIRIAWQRACAADYELQVSNDASTWTTMKSITGNTVGTASPPADWAAGVNHIGLSGVGRYVRINATASCSGNALSIWEIEVFGDANASCHP